MKAALIADVHGNLPALESVLNHARSQRVDVLWNLGDFLGYGPFPDEVVRRLRENGARSIIGNYDLKVLNFLQKEQKWRRTKDPAKFFSFRWTYKHITKDTKEYLRLLPHLTSLVFEKRRFLLVHGSPEAIDEPLTRQTPNKRLRELAENIDVDVICCGHTHQYFSRKVDHCRFINPGSVGRPFDLDERASYAVITVNRSGVSVRNYRVSYAVQDMVRFMRKEAFPEELIQSMVSARHLDKLKFSRKGARGTPKKTQASRQVQSSPSLREAAISLADSCFYEKQHTRQVTRIALKLFDGLRRLHGLGQEQRSLLEAAALLHDIGWLKGRTNHHKAARDIILNSRGLPLNKKEKMIVALTARYHRRAMPDNRHRHFRHLNQDDKQTVRKLASLLRIADGLDRSHNNCVNDLNCRVKGGRVQIVLKVSEDPSLETETAVSKADLFRKTFDKEIRFEIKTD